MTDNEIIKALEVCASKEIRCDECPFDEVCANYAIKDLLAFINCQKAEIEKLKEQVNLWQEEASSVGCANEWLKACLKEKNAEIERLKVELSARMELEKIAKAEFTLLSAYFQVKSVRAEAIKEFAKRLKEQYEIWDDDEYYFKYVTTDQIDNLVKEMVGESNV